MNDLISRKAVLDALCGSCVGPYMRNVSPEECRKAANCSFVKAIGELESVEAIPTSFPVSVTMEQVEAMRNTPFPQNEGKLMPLIDCAPVRHGHWEHSGKMERHVVLECSECRQGIEQKFAPVYKFCPNCGAKMDIEEKTNEEN